MLCMTLMTSPSFHSAFRSSENAELEEVIASHYSLPTNKVGSSNSSFKKKYQIIFDNKSEHKLDVAIRYKSYEGDWITDAWITMEPGEKKHMGSSDETTYYYFAKTQSKRRRQAWEGKHTFKIGDKSLNKVRFRKQDIWECYNAKTCNTFAVFR